MKILLVDKGRGGAQGGGPPLYMKKKSMSKIEPFGVKNKKKTKSGK